MGSEGKNRFNIDNDDDSGMLDEIKGEPASDDLTDENGEIEYDTMDELSDEGILSGDYDADHYD